MSTSDITTTSVADATAPATASWGELLSGANLARAIALTGGVALHAINVHIVTTILPSVVRDIGGLDYYAWNVTLFVATSIIGASLTSKLLDMHGPRRTYLLALVIFALGSVLCASAQSMPWMLAGRSVQGIGGGLLSALSYALIHFVFEQRLWSRAVALVSGMWGMATLLGPAVGGLFAAGGAWRLAFWSLLPVALVQALFVVMQLGRRRASIAGDDSAPVRVPLLKISLLAASVLLVALAGQLPGNAAKLAGVAAGLALGGLVAWLDRRPGVALLPAAAYSLDTVMGKVFACVFLLMIAGMTEIFVPYFLQTLHGYTPLQAGYLTAAMAGGWSLASLCGSGRSGRTAARLVQGGPLLMMLSLLALALLLPGQEGGVQAGVWLALALAGVGMGIGLGWPHLLTQVLQSAARGEESLASAGITTVQLYAMAIGAALAGLTANVAGLTDPGGMAGARTAALQLFVWFAVPAALAALLAWRLLQRR